MDGFTKVKLISLFFFFLFIAVTVYWGILERKKRRIFLLCTSLVCICLFSIHSALFFLVNIYGVHRAGLYLRSGGKNKARVIRWVLILLVADLCFFKYFNEIKSVLNHLSEAGVWLPTLELPVVLLPVGLSYLTFRLIHYLVETYRGSLPENSFADLVLYALFFPTFLAGPVERFQNFNPQASQPKPLDMSDINLGLFRIAAGIVRKFIIADNMGRFILPVLMSPSSYPKITVLVCVYGLIIRIYMDFAGYSDMAIGISRLFGYRIMENFNQPLLQKNIALYWRNWHISVYTWIRDYFFFPFFGYRASMFRVYIGMFFTLLLFMVWHQASMGYFIGGCYHGIGIVVWQLFQEVKYKKKGLRTFMMKPAVGIVSMVATFNFVALGVPLYLFESHQTIAIFNRIFSGVL